MITLIVKTNQNTYSALQFAKAAHHKNQLKAVFFFFDGAYLANKNIDMPTDEPDLSSAWQQFASETQVPLLVCSNSALRRGIVPEVLAAPFNLSSIGALVASCDESDRVVCL